jgi:hypothetical protein
MARPTKYNWEKIRKDLECGQNHEYVHKKYDVAYDVINKHLKRNPLEINQGAKSIIKGFDEVSQVISQVRDKRPDLVETATKIAIERNRHIDLFTKSILRNQAFADSKINDESNLNDLDTHSRLTNRNKDGVLGKEPTNVINNTNAQQNIISEIRITDA